MGPHGQGVSGVAGGWEAAVGVVCGLAVGSFAATALCRVPRGQSPVAPPSACDGCGRRLRPWELVPLVSYLALGGRCRTCGSAIPWQHPAGEALGGLVGGGVAWAAGLGPALLVLACLAAGTWAVAALIAGRAGRWGRCREGERGSLLAEAAVATAVLGLATVWVLGTVAYAAILWTDASRRTQAVTLARSWMEYLRSLPYDAPELQVTGPALHTYQVTQGGIPYTVVYSVRQDDVCYLPAPSSSAPKNRTYLAGCDTKAPKVIFLSVTFQRPGGVVGRVELVTVRGQKT